MRKTLSKAELRQNSKYNTLHHHSYRDVLTIPTLMRRLCPKLNLDKTANIIPNTIIPIETYCDNPYLDEKNRLCPKLNLDKTTNIIPYTIIPIETYCDNPYLDEKTLSKAELRQNSKYNTLHHHSYRDDIVTILTLMRRLCPKAELRQNSKYNTLHHHSYRDVVTIPTLMRRLCPKLNLDKTANIIIPYTIIPIETCCDNPYLDEEDSVQS
ncbi:unnamed protein product [Mytilus edulis]|uniref:Uncharacterized protein n=1 Tax=Mytilus edulis TaxID=6550 RepID=A0A8S3TPH1_MYTED|nr:unnamed protein product [Mytilus edulis]